MKPGTPLEPYLDVLREFDTLLVMTVEPGFGGQKFMAEVLPKVRLAREQVRAGHLRLFVEVDGGIDADTIAAAAEAGADVFVAGSAVYGADDPGKAVEALRVTARDAMSPRAATGSDRADRPRPSRPRCTAPWRWPRPCAAGRARIRRSAQ